MLMNSYPNVLIGGGAMETVSSGAQYTLGNSEDSARLQARSIMATYYSQTSGSGSGSDSVPSDMVPADHVGCRGLHRQALLQTHNRAGQFTRTHQ